MASKKEKTHVIDAPTAASNEYTIISRDRNATVLCGARLWYHVKGQAGRTARLAVVSLNGVGGLATRPGATKCLDCIKLAAMNSTERKAWHAKKADALAKLKADGGAKRVAVIAERVNLIERSRIDANVCLDAWLRGTGDLPRRCSQHAKDGADWRCRLPRYHDGPCAVEDANGQPLDPAIDIDDTLAVAIIAHKHEHKRFDAGKRLWMFKPSDDEDEAAKINGEKCVCCRFCLRILGSGRIGTDYSRHTFVHATGGTITPAFWAAFDGARIDNTGALRINVAEHTTLCALKYLAQVKPSADPEEQIKLGTASLPDKPFVLTFDDESECA